MVPLLRHVLPAVLTVLIAEIALAQVTGKVVGSVTDSDTGRPLVGAYVVVAGTVGLSS
jgi:hypothetical protein